MCGNLGPTLLQIRFAVGDVDEKLFVPRGAASYN